MRTFCLSGWGQPHDALSSIAPDAMHFDYAHHGSADAAIADIAKAAQAFDSIVGWSLGGQLAVRAVSKGLLKPKKLVLIGVPFQFVRGDVLKIGMPRDTYDLYCDNYKTNPERTLKKSWDLIAYNDTREADVKANLDKQNRKKELERNWHRWLQELSQFSCDDLDFRAFPPTLLIHGDKDAVVWHEQAEHFAKRMPKATLEIWRGCGHAPHWHDSEKLRESIKRHV